LTGGGVANSLVGALLVKVSFTPGRSDVKRITSKTILVGENLAHGSRRATLGVHKVNTNGVVAVNVSDCGVNERASCGAQTLTAVCSKKVAVAFALVLGVTVTVSTAVVGTLGGYQCRSCSEEKSELHVQ